MDGQVTACVVKSEWDPPGLSVIAGGDPRCFTWREYLDATWLPEAHPRLEAVRRAIEAAGLVGTCADQFCNDHYIECSTGERMAFTWRAWGDLMAAIVGKREGYMAYYVTGWHKPADSDSAAADKTSDGGGS